ncbi:hypothetical protein GLAREA_09302 [Glarea lozoyensis ATCC 20868]|uniref:DUF6604 domain-containing protein n=1 Tax=Glarea lozoyensis (strain ATCC 20868 / MF5171) TaxID=1116229 RepID=S3DJ12_GLAL2|nr:uncharacterized protein GLAREA_09302 [Glarea lozoyensis ATCC 20868]EPE37139.1 hypothetical protein GLAREA_09302 [Glarea lozoyensis ATCC 20868]
MEKSQEGTNKDEELEESIFANGFLTLQLEGSSDGEESTEETHNHSDKPSAHPRKKPAGKGKKGKKGKKPKPKTKPLVKEPDLAEVPLESYRIIEDDDGIITDYLMAVYSLVTQWIEFRQYLARTWRQTCYEGLNTAVAGTLSNTCIAWI